MYWPVLNVGFVVGCVCACVRTCVSVSVHVCLQAHSCQCALHLYPLTSFKFQTLLVYMFKSFTKIYTCQMCINESHPCLYMLIAPWLILTSICNVWFLQVCLLPLWLAGACWGVWLVVQLSVITPTLTPRSLGATRQYYQLTGPFIWAMQSFLHV